MNRNVKIINAYTIQIDEEYITEDVFHIGSLFSGDNSKHWNKILKKAFQENDIDLIIQFRLEKNDKNDY